MELRRYLMKGGVLVGRQINYFASSRQLNETPSILR